MDEVTVSDVLERGRAAHAQRAWLDTYESLSRADASAPLEPADIELLAEAAYMLGRDDGWVRGLERAHHAHLDAGDIARAARCAWWLGATWRIRGETARASGWFGRGGRLLEREGGDCVEHGYLRLCTVYDSLANDDAEAAQAAAAHAAAIGERFGDRDLVTIARMEQGHALVRLGRSEEGLRLVDETMVAVTVGELSPIVAGVVYCNTIAFCQTAHEVRRAREWTNALAQWCEGQPDMVAHTGICLVHRAEVLQFHGAWPAALEEAQRAVTQLQGGALRQRQAGSARYRQGEVHRLRGECEAAEEAYRAASRLGCEPYPGLALLRLGQGRIDAAAAAIRRIVDETVDPLQRSALLPAQVEIMLAVGDLEEARRAADALRAIAEAQASDLLHGAAAHAGGAVALAEGDAADALMELRRALAVWQELEAPYEAARTRVLVGLACGELGDDETAALELEAARAVFEDLSAAPDLAHVRSLRTPAPARGTHGLTARELQVLRLLARGQSNRGIATDLVLSERTVERHVSNIFAKLRVSSRAAATACAYQRDLL